MSKTEKRSGTFTPGPWVVGRETRIGDATDPDAIYVDRGRKHSRTIVGGPNFVADAHLIAAAPDLYAACEAFVNAGAMTASDMNALKDQATAALQRARGEAK